MNATAAAFTLAAVAYLWISAKKIGGPIRLVKIVPALLLAASLRAESALALAFILYAAGDLFLLDKGRAFLAGLGAFLVGHIVLIGWIAAHAGRPPSVVAILAGTVAGGVMLAALWPALPGKLRVAVPIYTFALVGLVTAGSAWDDTALLAAIVFLVSDALLGWQKFRAPLPHGDTLVLTTYYVALALFGLALGPPVPVLVGLLSPHGPSAS